MVLNNYSGAITPPSAYDHGWDFFAKSRAWVFRTARVGFGLEKPGVSYSGTWNRRKI